MGKIVYWTSHTSLVQNRPLDFCHSQTCFSTNQPQHDHAPHYESSMMAFSFPVCHRFISKLYWVNHKNISMSDRVSASWPTALVQAIIVSCLDTCNSHLTGLPASLSFSHTICSPCSRQSDLLRTRCLCITFRINSESFCGLKSPNMS